MMLKATFNLSIIPFSKDIDTHNLFMHEQFTEMIRRLVMLFHNRGIGLFTGEVGCGKSTAIRTAMQNIPSQTHRPVYLYRGMDDLCSFYKQIAVELGIIPMFKKSDIARQVISTIADLYTQQKIVVVLIIDEAHLLKPDILDEIRLIHNSDYDSADYLATALIGQPPLKKMITYNKFLPLRQRISVAYHLNPLSKNDSYNYFNHQLDLAKPNVKIFMDNAIETIVTAAKGIPRIINTIALKAMTIAADKKMTTVDQECVMLVLAELGI